MNKQSHLRGNKGSAVRRESQVSIKVGNLRKYSVKTEVSLFSVERVPKSTVTSPSVLLYFELVLWANFLPLRVCDLDRKHDWVC